MSRARTGCMVGLMLLPWVLGGCFSLLLLQLPAVEPACPEPCDCPQQQHLLCTNRGLRAVPKAADPQGLRLDGNALGSLGDAAFSGLPNLLYLHLEANRIRWLSRGAFAGLAKLRFLDLSGNQQSSLRHPATFEPLRSLSTLLLSGNSLQQLGGGLFRHLPGLATLSLSGNRLAQLAPDAFAGLGALKELRLDGNLLSRLPTALLEPLRSLEALDLSRNALAALHAAAFARLPKLRELSLRDNALATLPAELFAASPALQRLELDGNAWSCDCRLRALKRWLATWHAQGRLLTVFVQCRLPLALAGKYLDYLPDAQLLLPPDGAACPAGAAPRRRCTCGRCTPPAGRCAPWAPASPPTSPASSPTARPAEAQPPPAPSARPTSLSFPASASPTAPGAERTTCYSSDSPISTAVARGNYNAQKALHLRHGAVRPPGSCSPLAGRLSIVVWGLHGN
uniref:TLR4 interactor with leucine rich repeats n=1 Tax=Pelusios castaneus TaxID=367368 RepID=A0A8C8RQZ2_9SAUR